MVDVGGHDHVAAGDFVADELGSDFLALRDVEHLFGDAALTGVVHLGEIAVLVLGSAASEPFGARLRNRIVAVCAVRVGTVFRLAIGRGHGLRNLTRS